MNNPIPANMRKPALIVGGVTAAALLVYVIMGRSPASAESGDGGAYPSLLFAPAGSGVTPLMTGGSGVPGSNAGGTGSGSAAETIAGAISVALAQLQTGERMHYADNATMLFNNLPETLGGLGGGKVSGTYQTGTDGKTTFDILTTLFVPPSTSPLTPQTQITPNAPATPSYAPSSQQQTRGAGNYPANPIEMWLGEAYYSSPTEQGISRQAA